MHCTYAPSRYIQYLLLTHILSILAPAYQWYAEAIDCFHFPWENCNWWGLLMTHDVGVQSALLLFFAFTEEKPFMNCFNFDFQISMARDTLPPGVLKHNVTGAMQEHPGYDTTMRLYCEIILNSKIRFH